MLRDVILTLETKTIFVSGPSMPSCCKIWWFILPKVRIKYKHGIKIRGVYSNKRVFNILDQNKYKTSNFPLIFHDLYICHYKCKNKMRLFWQEDKNAEPVDDVLCIPIPLIPLECVWSKTIESTSMFFKYFKNQSRS